MLQHLRTRFLSFEAKLSKSEDYWTSAAELANYDFTFAERIGWKWDTVIAELQARGWTPPTGAIFDYGCGTGIAGRRVVEAWRGAAQKLVLWDRSNAAMQFARSRASVSFPGLKVEFVDQVPETMVISHVLNELDPLAIEQLIARVAKATVVLWVEPGTAQVSRALIEVRKRLLAQTHGDGSAFRPVAPCPHALDCGMLSAGNERHWCHHFAKVPSFVFQDAGWAKFAKTLEVDLRSIPFSFLVLDRRPAAAEEAAGNSRVIGHPRYYKGFHKVLTCQEEGVLELPLQKRDAPELYKQMKKDPGSLYQWEMQAGKIRGGKRVF